MMIKQLLKLTIFVLIFTNLQAQLRREDRRLSEKELFQKFAKLMKKIGLWKKLTSNEKKFRFKTFKENLNIIEKSVPPPLGKDGRPLLGSVAASFRKGINKFAFLTKEEFENQYLIKQSVFYAKTSAQAKRNSSENFFDSFQNLGSSKSKKPRNNSSEFGSKTFENIDDELDSFDDNSIKLNSLFRNLNGFMGKSQEKLESNGYISPRGRILQSERNLQQTVYPGLKNKISWEHLFNPIFDQKDCNSCYAAASLGAIEAMYKKENMSKSSIYLSVQEIMDCSNENSACLGGQPSTVMQYVKDHGVGFATEYPYESQKKVCRAKYYLNDIKKKSGPRILESLLANSSERILQYTRFASDPRLNNYQNNFTNTYRNPSNPRIPYNNANQGFNQFANQNQRNSFTQQGFNPQNTNTFTNNYAAVNPQLNYNYQQNWNQNNGFNNFQPVAPAFPTPTRQLKLDGPKGVYYYEIVSYPNGVKKIDYVDMNNLVYVPSFVEAKNKEKEEEKKEEDQKEEEEDLLPLDDEEEEETPTTSPPFFNPEQNGRFEQLKGFYFLKQNVIDVLKALQYGPVVTAHFVSEPFKFYESGVFDGSGCDQGKLEYVNHASVIVGYDLTATIPYFKLRNSWADDWGESGYYRMKIGELSKNNQGICLVAGTPFMVFPYLQK